MTLDLSRRSFFAGLGAAIAAPAIVRAASLMPVRAIVPAGWVEMREIWSAPAPFCVVLHPSMYTDLMGAADAAWREIIDSDTRRYHAGLAAWQSIAIKSEVIPA